MVAFSRESVVSPFFGRAAESAESVALWSAESAFPVVCFSRPVASKIAEAYFLLSTSFKITLLFSGVSLFCLFDCFFDDGVDVEQVE